MLPRKRHHQLEVFRPPLQDSRQQQATRKPTDRATRTPKVPTRALGRIARCVTLKVDIAGRGVEEPRRPRCHRRADAGHAKQAQVDAEVFQNVGRRPHVAVEEALGLLLARRRRVAHDRVGLVEAPAGKADLERNGLEEEAMHEHRHHGEGVGVGEAGGDQEGREGPHRPSARKSGRPTQEEQGGVDGSVTGERGCGTERRGRREAQEVARELLRESTRRVFQVGRRGGRSGQQSGGLRVRAVASITDVPRREAQSRRIPGPPRA